MQRFPGVISAASGNKANAAAIATLVHTSVNLTYVTGIEVKASGATAALPVLVTLTGILGGTLTWVFTFPAGALVEAAPLVVTFNPPLQSVDVNTDIVLTLPSSGAGGTNASVVMHGFVGSQRYSVSSTTQGPLRSDNFTRADTTNNIGTPSDGGTAWVQQSGAWGITSNQGYMSDFSSRASSVLEASNANVAVQATMSVVSTNGGLVARAVNDSNYILLQIITTSLTIYKRVAGVFTQVGTTYSGTISNNDVIKLTCDSANNLTAYQNGVARITDANDSAGSTNTKCGIYSDNDGSRFISFSVTAL